MSLTKSDKTFIRAFKIIALGAFLVAIWGIACDGDSGEVEVPEPVTPMVEDVEDMDVVDDVVASDVVDAVDALEEAETEDVQEEVDSSDSDQ